MQRPDSLSVLTCVAGLGPLRCVITVPFATVPGRAPRTSVTLPLRGGRRLALTSPTPR
jgi:hypothetical protein